MLRHAILEAWEKKLISGSNADLIEEFLKIEIYGRTKALTMQKIQISDHNIT